MGHGAWRRPTTADAMATADGPPAEQMPRLLLVHQSGGPLLHPYLLHLLHQSGGQCPRAMATADGLLLLGQSALGHGEWGSTWKEQGRPVGSWTWPAWHGEHGVASMVRYISRAWAHLLHLLPWAWAHLVLGQHPSMGPSSPCIGAASFFVLVISTMHPRTWPTTREPAPMIQIGRQSRLRRGCGREDEAIALNP
jgi:hypothetical protein